jgi:hypothetical protein
VTSQEHVSLVKQAEQAGVRRARLRIRPVRPRCGASHAWPAEARRVDVANAVSLNDLVLPGHRSRHRERAFDLTFIRELVRQTSAETD